MNKTDEKRQIIIEMAADHLLERGMQEATLRKLAKSVGVSDRMLMHYFSNKEELLQAILTVITARLVHLLESAKTEQMPFEKFLFYLASMMKAHQVRPFLRLSLELAAMSSQGESFYTAIAKQICDDFFRWMARTLKVDCEEQRIPLAALAFATTEGLMVLDALGSASIVEKALAGIELKN